jgi:hypothetical protein
LAASIVSTTMSASPAPPQAASTMARSRRRRGAKIPGVSMNTSWLAPSMAMPRSGMRVVCTLWLTIETLAPTRALTSVDLPALGAPMTAMKPQRVSSPAPARSLPCPHTPSRTSSAVAAACSAARLLAPSPRAGFRPLMRTSEVKRGAWSGPRRATSA